MGKRRRFTKEFKDDAVRLVRLGNSSITEVAKSIGVHRTQLSDWVKQAEIDGAGGGSAVLTTAERDELTRLRRENKQLSMERDFLKRAAAFFAKDGSKGSS